MHEVSVMHQIIELASEQARLAQARRIHAIRVRVGDLSGVVAEALEFAFECAARDTLAASARLEIERVPAVCYCQACRKEFAPEAAGFVCPHCQTVSPHLRRGRELDLISLEVS